ncbi:putative DNA primase/helicase [Gammaproteobacteria bacterium]
MPFDGGKKGGKKNLPDDAQGGEDGDSKEKPFSKKELCYWIPFIIDSGKKEYLCNLGKFQSFGRKFVKFKPSGYQTEILEVLEDEIVIVSSIDEVRDALVKYVRNSNKSDYPLMFFLDNCIDAEVAKQQAENWLATFVEYSITELPPAVRFKSDHGLCFSRLDFDPIDNATIEDAPTWKKVLDRMTNSESFSMRIASLFDENANRKQALWLHGKGDTGKSLVIEEIGKLFKGSFLPSSYKQTLGDFWLWNLIGKRVVYINECHPNFVTNDLSDFKGITGEREQLVNRKGKAHVPIRIDCILLMTSNHPLKLPADDALHNRIIDCEISELPPELKNSDEKLVRAALAGELQVFLSWAWALYQERKFPNGRIPSDGSKLQEATDELDDAALEFFGVHFEFKEGHRTAAIEVRRVLTSNGEYLSDNKYALWVKAWARLGVKKVRQSRNGVRIVEFSNLKIRAPDHKRVTAMFEE